MPPPLAAVHPQLDTWPNLPSRTIPQGSISVMKLWLKFFRGHTGQVQYQKKGDLRLEKWHAKKQEERLTFAHSWTEGFKAVASTYTAVPGTGQSST